MAKIARDAALIIGAVAITVASAGTLAPVATAAALGTIGVTASAAALSTALALAATGLTVLSSLLQKKPKAIGNPMAWQSDPQAGIPIIIGRMYSGGKIVYRNTWGGKDLPNQTLITAYSIGPISGFEGYFVDGVLTTISGTVANIPDYGYMNVSSQLGAQPEASQLGALGPPNWTTSSKLSGLAASSITLKYDTKGKNTMTTEPQCGYVIHGVRVYDPRKDSTYPGGSGTQRVTDETTWSYTGYDNPYLAALAWLIGWRQNGHLVAGVGVPTAAILFSQFVEGANVADANGWKCGGILDTTDDKWDRLKDILLAGGGEPLRLGAQIGVLINTPRVSLATVTVDDVVGDASVQATQAMRDRINAVVPRYMAEQSVTTTDSNGNNRTTHTWGMAAAGPVIVSSYVTFDGKQRQKQVDFEFVQGVSTGNNAPNQVAQLARYAIENAREFGPITLPMKLRWMGYKPGDVITCNLPELGLVSQDILIMQRELSPQDSVVTMTARSETYAKHAFALGQTTTAPPTPTVTGPSLVPTPGASAWAITATSFSQNGQVVPALVVTGAVDTSVIDGIVFEDRIYTGTQGVDDDWHGDGIEPPSILTKPITGLIGGIQYQVSVRYRKGSSLGDRLILGPSTPNVASGLGGPGSWTILNRENMTIIGSTVYKSGGTNGWGDASVVSAESYVGGASCAFIAAQNNADLMVGLNTDPGADDSYTSIDFAWYLAADGNCVVYEGGSAASAIFPYSVGDIFQIVYNGTTVNYLQNGTIRYSHTVTSSLQLWLDSSFNTVGGKVTNLTFTGTGSKGDQGVPGSAGAPGANNYTWVAYADSADGASNFTTGSPGTRGYQGLAFNETTATESTNYLDYQWIPYRGPATFGLATTNPSDIVVGPDYVVCRNEPTPWTDGAFSTEGWSGGAQLAFTVIGAPSNDYVVGLNSDPTTDNNYTSIDYGVYIGYDNAIHIVESGTFLSGFGSYAANDRFQVRYDGANVTYSRNGVVFRSVAASPGLTFYLDSSFSGAGTNTRFDKIAFGAAGQAGADGVTASLTQAAVQIAAYSDGTLKGGALANANGVFKILKGTADVSGSTSFSVLSTTNCSVTIDSSGNYAVSSVSADSATATFRAAYNGVNYDRTLSITLSKDGTPAYAQSNTTSGTFSNTGTYAQVMSVTIDTSSGQGLNCTAVGHYTASSGSFTMQQKLQYSLNAGSTWTDISGSEQSGPISSGEGETVSSSGSVTSSTIGTASSVMVRTLWRRSAGTGSSVGVTGKETVAWANV